MITMSYEGRRLAVRPTERPGVSLDLYVNRHYVGSTRRGSSAEAQMAALAKLVTMVQRADRARKPELYDAFWFETPLSV